MRVSIRDIARVAGACCGLTLTGATLAGPISAQVLYRDNDFISPVGSVTNFSGSYVNNSGSWMVEVTTNGPADSNVVVMRDNAILAQENDAIEPPPAAISSFDSMRQNSHGNIGWNLFLRNMTSSTDSGVYYNTTLVIPEGYISQATGFSPETPYIGFFEVMLNDNNQMMVMASVDDPNIASTVDRAIMLLELDPDGTLLSETVLYKEGDLLPGQVEAVADFGTGPHSMSFNNAGQVMFVADLTGPTTTDGVIYINDTLIAQEGSPSPIPGRPWATLSTSTRMHINNSGGYVHTGTLSGDTASDLIIVKDGRKFVQEGDNIPAIGDWTFQSFGSGPVYIADNGDVLWYGDWNDPDTTRDTGLFINDTLLIQQGVTEFDGLTVTTIRGISDGYSMSPNGRYITARVVLTGNLDAVVLLDRGDQTTPCPADWNGDESVNSNDISAFLASWLSDITNGTTDADFDNSGQTNSNDISAFLAAWLDAVQNGC